MATITSIQSGNWGTAGTWDSGVPVNGDTVIIAEGHTVLFDVDQSGFANGLAALTINGILHFTNTANTCLKMNGNITGTGRLYVAQIWEMDPVEYEYELVTGYSHVYKNSGIAWLETLAGADFTEVESIDEVESTPNSFYKQFEEYVEYTYWHQADATCRVFTAINRAAPGSEYRCYLLFNSTGKIDISSIKMFGYYDELEYTQLSADASSGQNQIVLTEDLDLQEGDIICIGCGSLNYGFINQPDNANFTVESYNSETKTVTLTSNLMIDRLEDDYVTISNRPIKINRTSGTGAIINTPIDNMIFVGVSVLGIYFIYPTQTGSGKDLIYNRVQNIKISHCTGSRYFLRYAKNVEISNYVHNDRGDNYPSLYALENVLIENSIGIGREVIGINSQNQLINNCIIQNHANNPTSTNCVIKNSKLLNFKLGGIDGNSTLINCILSGDFAYPTTDGSSLVTGSYVSTYINCTFLAGGVYGLSEGKLFNCVFEEGFPQSIEHIPLPYKSVESFDDNQIPGNYKAWCKGGTIETDTDGLSNPLPGQLIFNCQSADYPVFRDFKVMIPGYRTQKWQALCNKSFTGGEVKIELIDPSSDPLIDSSATPLATYTLPDQADTNLPLKLGYKSDKPMEAILRISATNADGSVEVDTSLIENRINHGS